MLKKLNNLFRESEDSGKKVHKNVYFLEKLILDKQESARIPMSLTQYDNIDEEDEQLDEYQLYYIKLIKQNKKQLLLDELLEWRKQMDDEVEIGFYLLFSFLYCKCFVFEMIICTIKNKNFTVNICNI